MNFARTVAGEASEFLTYVLPHKSDGNLARTIGFLYLQHAKDLKIVLMREAKLVCNLYADFLNNGHKLRFYPCRFRRLRVPLSMNADSFQVFKVKPSEKR